MAVPLDRAELDLIGQVEDRLRSTDITPAGSRWESLTALVREAHIRAGRAGAQADSTIYGHEMPVLEGARDGLLSQGRGDLARQLTALLRQVYERLGSVMALQAGGVGLHLAAETGREAGRE